MTQEDESDLIVRVDRRLEGFQVGKVYDPTLVQENGEGDEANEE